MSAMKGWWPYEIVSWPGVRVYPSHDIVAGADDSPVIVQRPLEDHDDGGAAGSDFSRLFTPVLPRYAEHCWVFDSDAFGYDAETADASQEEMELFRVGPEHYCVTRQRFLEERRQWVRDDWNRFIGIPGPCPSGQELFDEHGVPLPNLLDHADVIFDNYDGAYWAFYSRDPAVVEEVILHARKFDRATVVPCTFRETYDKHDEEWRRWEQRWRTDEIAG